MVEIVDYQERWPLEFQAIAAPLRQTLGPLAQRIDHIGSTSVPNLPAKNLIDIQITVAALDDRVKAAMVSLGYTFMEGWRDHRPPLAVGPETDWDSSDLLNLRVSAASIFMCACRDAPINATRCCSATI